ncbi:MAG: phosphonate C-P lyase system protein PhnG [Paracoccaceae bacterium]|uniref:phosphonate C-P lyase system protein PhnG n=1 Tax=unclassified Seohaeicola TaxID=2641111 RepID=UPI00237C1185|nr:MULTISPECIES: phosphonate C-P lyase system protein PhnG [unclassified Seohaeicola]MDF1708522.1 phosphonate C-P lyase system protein PhnG [Paracoccaceae bacterium]MDD9709264.1 phosphonate C-P lyase system protein PhnG [Seohaeicola sp. 4SK31]MDD9737470.1 phosphonate C-P lyase system protein PhnG [Seohaeicola sp. SP36]MDM7971400.1 phosphonate C-P lyase system protein PhnG [Paracoccaceae bacterium]HSG57522.1 phosphonate C-P lyase system protein PhnG [Paracoccaceae bacterium]
MDRKDWMGLLARAPADLLDRLWRGVNMAPAFRWLRAPEVGGVMVQGRAGGTGAPFNLGEMTVTRCALVLEGGAVGHAYVQGRDKRQAEQAALVDALMQGPEAGHLRAAVLEPLLAEVQARAGLRAAKAAATKVEFFTLVRGDD